MPRFCRLPVLCLAVLLLLLTCLPVAAMQITDVRGRTITVPDQVDSLAIDDGRYLVALALILDDPVKPLAAWPHDVNRLTGPMYQAFTARFPKLASLPKIASSAEPFNLESLLAVAPDVAVLSLQSNISASQVQLLQRVGIPVVFIDFFTHPEANQARSLKILGRLTGGLAQAEAYIAFRNRHLAKIEKLAATLAPEDRPTVFMEAHAGISPDCCYSPGRGNVGRYIRMVGGHNIGADVLKSATGKLSLEYIMATDPDVYIATGGASLEKHGGLVLGAGFDAATARRTLTSIVERKGIRGLTAVKTGHTHGLAHQLLNSPLDIVAIEVMATWIHPKLYADVHPQATLDAINKRFLAVPLKGSFWVSLQ